MTDGTGKPLISYPTTWDFKVMGPKSDAEAFHAFVRELFAEVLGAALHESAVTARESSQGKYLALNVSLTLTSEEQRQAIYARLHHEHQQKRILYYL